MIHTNTEVQEALFQRHPEQRLATRDCAQLARRGNLLSALSLAQLFPSIQYSLYQDEDPVTEGLICYWFCLLFFWVEFNMSSSGMLVQPSITCMCRKKLGSAAVNTYWWSLPLISGLYEHAVPRSVSTIKPSDTSHAASAGSTLGPEIIHIHRGDPDAPQSLKCSPNR